MPEKCGKRQKIPELVPNFIVSFHFFNRILNQVLTGVALFYGGEALEPHVQLFVEATTVCFAELPLEAIRAYVATGEPFDKAGGYGIQARGAVLVQGCLLYTSPSPRD